MKTTKVVKKAAPPAKPQGINAPEEKGMLRKFTDSVTDSVKDTIKVLTPDSQGTQKADNKVAKKTEKKVVELAEDENELLVKESEKQEAPEKANTLRDTFKKLTGGSEKPEDE